MQILTRHSTPSSALPPGSEERLDQFVTQIAESDTFRTAPMMRTLLAYLWNHKGEPISEYAIAVEALGRSPNFDPKTDSTVRVQIARLRTKLKEFYGEADPSFPLKLSIPLGRHEIHFVYEQAPPSSPLSRLAGTPKPYLIGAGAYAFLLLLCVFLLVQNRSLKNSIVAPGGALPQFWQAFLSGGKPATIVVPSPLYFFWPESDLYARDLKITDFSKWPTSPVLTDLANRLGKPTLAQTYVGAMEMTTSIRILQYLDTHAQPVQLIDSRKFSTDTLGAQNTIFLGMPRTAVYLDQLAQKLNFYIAGVQPDVVRSRHPDAGEPAEFKQADYSNDRTVNPAIIAFLPPRPEHTRSLLLMGRVLTGIPAILTTIDGLKLLDEQWKKAGSPEAWEMVIETELYRGDTVVKLRPAAFRPIRADFWQ